MVAVVDGLVCKEPTVMAWGDGERAAWSSPAVPLDHGPEQPGWAATPVHAQTLTPLLVSWLIVHGPEASALAVLRAAAIGRHSRRGDLARAAVARFELDVLPFALAEAQDSPDRFGMLVLPFRAPEVATLVAGWLGHLGSARLWARLWLERHAATAARALIPVAAGRPGQARQQAERALRHLNGAGHAAAIADAATEYGAETVAVIAQLREPAGTRAPRARALPAWARPDRLPELRLAGGGSLPHDEVAKLVDALSRVRVADPPEPPPGDPAPRDGGPPVAVESSAAVQPLVQPPQTALDGLNRQDLAVFGRALLDAWVADGLPPADAWVVLAQAHLGDDDTMDVVAALRRTWAGGSRWARALDGLAVLATADTEVALRHVLALEQRLTAGSTKDRALAYLTQAAARRGLSVTQLADRLTPTHGLGTGVTLDYGPRAFTAVADERLTVCVVDADGRRLTRPPKPGVKDTNPAAYQQFTRLKKEYQATAAAQSDRLRQDLFARRRRPARDLPAVLLPHPVLGPLARRLLWGEYDPHGRLVRALRIAEDGSLADLGDDAATVAGDAPVGVVHPAELGGDLPRWRQRFDEYEILQPFPQLDRPVATLTEAQRAATSLPGSGRVPTERILALLRDGRWRGNGTDLQSAPQTQLSLDLGGGLALVVELDPGVTHSMLSMVHEQRVTELWADDSRSGHWQTARRIPLGALDRGALSEALVELYGPRPDATHLVDL